MSDSASPAPSLPLPSSSEKELSLAIIDPNGEANLWRYDSCLYNSLDHENLDKDIITSDHFQANNIPNRKIHRFYHYKRHRGPIGKGVSYLFGCLRTYHFILSNKIEVVHFQWFKIPTIDWIGLFFIRALSKSIKIVYTAHNVLPHDTGRKHFASYKRIYRAVDAIIVHTSASKEEITRSFGIPEQKIHVIPHGILHEIRTRGSSPRKNQLPSILECYPNIATILGRINRYKGHDRAIIAWKNSTIARDGTWLLVIAGQGDESYIHELRELAGASRNILIIDRFLDDAEFDELSQRTSLSIFPYRNISQSGALLTSLAFSKPIVVCDVGGLGDPLRIADVGWAFSDSEFTERLTALLNQVSTDEETLYEKAANLNGWKAIWREYSWENIGQLTLSLYKSIH